MEKSPNQNCFGNWFGNHFVCKGGYYAHDSHAITSWWRVSWRGGGGSPNFRKQKQGRERCSERVEWTKKLLSSVRPACNSGSQCHPPRIAPRRGFSHGLGREMQFIELLPECLRIPRVAPRMAFALRERSSWNWVPQTSQVQQDLEIHTHTHGDTQNWHRPHDSGWECHTHILLSSEWPAFGSVWLL